MPRRREEQARSKKTAALGDTSSSSSRPLRDRKAPERFSLAAFSSPSARQDVRASKKENVTKPSVYSSSVKGKGRARLQIEDEDEVEELRAGEEERAFVAVYSYSHIGQEGKQGSADVWVEVPSLETFENSAPMAERAVGEDVSLSEVIAPGVKAATSSSESVLTAAAPGRLQREGDLWLDLSSPPSMEVKASIVEAQTGMTNCNIGETGPSSAHYIPVKGVSVQSAPDTSFNGAFPSIKQEASTPTQVKSPGHVEEQLDRLDVAPRQQSEPIDPSYHPEHRLSHRPDEGLRTSRMSSDARSGHRSRRVDEKVDKARPLFFGSDNNDDDHDDAASSTESIRRRQRSPGKTTAGRSLTPDTPSLPRSTVASEPATTSIKRSSVSAKNMRSDRVQESAQIFVDRTDVSRNGAYDKRKRRRRKDGTEPPEKDRKRKKKHARNREHSDQEGNDDDDDNDLRQDLNIDRYVQSTSNKAQDAKRAKQLERLRQQKIRNNRRRRGEVLSSSESSSGSEEDESDSDNNDDSNNDSGDGRRHDRSFIVDDEDEPTTVHNKKQALSRHPKGSLSPPSLVSKDYVAEARRLSRRDKLEEYLRWIIIHALDDINLTKGRRKQLEAIRTSLREQYRMLFQSLTSQTNRRQFTWYLKHYPFFERRLMSKEEKKQHRGCASCHRANQTCEYVFICWGKLYRESNLTMKSSDTSSDMTTDADRDWKVVGQNEQGARIFTFYLGETCAKLASVKHKLHHWERRVLNEVVKLPAFKSVARKSRDYQDIELADIDAVVKAYYNKLSIRLARLESDVTLLRTNSEAYSRLRESWNDDP